MATKKGKKPSENPVSSTTVPYNKPIVVGIGASAGGLEAFEKFFTKYACRN